MRVQWASVRYGIGAARFGEVAFVTSGATNVHGVNIVIIGGGPAGLFLSILLKKAMPQWLVSVYEQNPRGNTFGWGIVFSDGTMENLALADQAVARLTQESLAHWDDIEVHFKGRVMRSSGHGFIGVGRHRFLEILTNRAEELGVALHFGCRVTGPKDFSAADLIVGADGVSSVVRASLSEEFGTDITRWNNRFTWLGTRRPFPAFSFFFEETEHGWFQAHCYQFSDDTSTFIVECPEETWRSAGLDRMSKPDGIAFCEILFADHLDGHELLDNSPHLDGPGMWLTFPKINNETWHHGNVVLLGDASATAHFSIGSGTKLALESAMALAEKVVAGLGAWEQRGEGEGEREKGGEGEREKGGTGDGGFLPKSEIRNPKSREEGDGGFLPKSEIRNPKSRGERDPDRLPKSEIRNPKSSGERSNGLDVILAEYEAERRIEVLKLQNAARNSTEWFESVSLRCGMAAEQFTYSLLTRSQRVSHENLRLRDKTWLEGYETWWAQWEVGEGREEERGREGERGKGRKGDGSFVPESEIPNPKSSGGRRSEGERARAREGDGGFHPKSEIPNPKSGGVRRRDGERGKGRKGERELDEKAIPPMFLPLRLRGLELPNRVAVSPMAMYSAEEGLVGDFHLVHLGARALGGAGLVFTEMTCVSPEGRITPGCAGLWNDEQAEAYRRIVRFVHDNSPARIALQIGHSGRKGSCKRPFEANGNDNAQLDDGNWPLISSSPLPYLPHNQTPREMTEADMEHIRDEFVAATKRGIDVGFDLVELHCAHGYLMSSFLSPLTNQRADEYGGSLENRLRFPLEVFDAMRAVWPEDRPMSVRISATDWVDGGTTLDDSITTAGAFADHGADIVDVSTGQVSPEQQPVYGRMFQTPYAERIRLEADVAVMAVGNIYEPDHVNSILASGRADLCLLARPHLADPQWTLRAAADLVYQDQWWPPQYLSAKTQLARILERQKAMT